MPVLGQGEFILETSLGAQPNVCRRETMGLGTFSKLGSTNVALLSVAVVKHETPRFLDTVSIKGWSLCPPVDSGQALTSLTNRVWWK